MTPLPPGNLTTTQSWRSLRPSESLAATVELSEPPPPGTNRWLSPWAVLNTPHHESKERRDVAVESPDTNWEASQGKTLIQIRRYIGEWRHHETPSLAPALKQEKKSHRRRHALASDSPQYHSPIAFSRLSLFPFELLSCKIDSLKKKKIHILFWF